MGEIPTTVNGTAQTVDQIINTVIYDLALPGAEAALIVAVPFLGWPIINTIFTYLFGLIAKSIYKYVAINLTINVIIPAQTGAERDAYVKAESVLRAAHLSGDTAAIANATELFKAAASSFIHYDGSATP